MHQNWTSVDETEASRVTSHQNNQLDTPGSKPRTPRGLTRPMPNTDLAAILQQPSPTESEHVQPFHILRYPENPYFIGRDDFLDHVSSCLLPGNPKATRNSRTAAFAIWGAPGQGKTQTALHFAYKNRGHFTSILWAFADTENKLLQCFSEYAQAIGLLEKSKDLYSDSRALMDWYATTSMLSALPFSFVFDFRQNTGSLTSTIQIYHGCWSSIMQKT
jgi:hypothetical protein